MLPIRLNTYLWTIFAIATLANLLIAAMFYARVAAPARAQLWGSLSLALGFPALLAVIAAWLSDYSHTHEGGALYWIGPLIFVVFCLFTLLLDYVLHIEFRNPRRLVILIPFLILFYIGLIMMWGMLWNLHWVPWAINGMSYFIMVAASLYALRQGVG